MKKILSVLTMFVILGSTVPAFANGMDRPDMHRNNMPVQERIQPAPEPDFHEVQRPNHHNGREVSRIIKGAAIGAIIASIFN